MQSEFKVGNKIKYREYTGKIICTPGPSPYYGVSINLPYNGGHSLDGRGELVEVPVEETNKEQNE